jgi:NADH:ubiquinone oxidoreductase subunit 3 (subunit A)
VGSTNESSYIVTHKLADYHSNPFPKKCEKFKVSTRCFNFKVRLLRFDSHMIITILWHINYHIIILTHFQKRINFIKILRCECDVLSLMFDV